MMCFNKHLFNNFAQERQVICTWVTSILQEGSAVRDSLHYFTHVRI